MEIIVYDTETAECEFFGRQYKRDSPLRRDNHAVQNINQTLDSLVRNMHEILVESGGVGLAAPQVGVNLTLFLARIGDEVTTFINPVITHRYGRQKNWEGCLSLPQIAVEVQRAKRIIIEWYDIEGKFHSRKFSNENAMILQHEYDHLQGRLIIDNYPQRTTATIKDTV